MFKSLGDLCLTCRCLGPTDMATMDYRMDRLNIRLDEDRKING